LRRLLHCVYVGKLLRGAHLAGDARVLNEGVLVTHHEIPIQHRERAGIVTCALFAVVRTAFAMVAHTVDIRTTAGIWLGGQHSAIGIERHANHVGHHDPLGCVSSPNPCNG
jgi:hypothetical protein